MTYQNRCFRQRVAAYLWLQYLTFLQNNHLKQSIRVKRRRRGFSTSHCDSCGLENQQYMRDCARSAACHAYGDSQGPRPVLSRFAAARTAVACREFVGERWLPPAIAGGCRDIARPALVNRISNDLLFGVLMRMKCECPQFRQSNAPANMAKKIVMHYSQRHTAMLLTYKLSYPGVGTCLWHVSHATDNQDVAMLRAEGTSLSLIHISEPTRH